MMLCQVKIKFEEEIDIPDDLVARRKAIVDLSEQRFLNSEEQEEYFKSRFEILEYIGQRFNIDVGNYEDDDGGEDIANGVRLYYVKALPPIPDELLEKYGEDCERLSHDIS